MSRSIPGHEIPEVEEQVMGEERERRAPIAIGATNHCQ